MRARRNRREETTLPSNEENKAVAKAWIDAYNEKDFDRLREVFADDIELTDLGMGISVTGGETLVEAMRAVAEERIPDRHNTPERIVVEGDVAIIQGRWRGVPLVETWGKPAGSVLQHRYCSVLEIENGKIKKFTDYTCHEK